MPGRWQRVDDLFTQAVALPDEERAAWLAAACGDDITVRREVEGLLAHDGAAASNFLAPILPSGVHELPSEMAAAGVSAGKDGFADPLIGRRVGRFEVRAVIAVGGMGTVYEAVQDQPHRVVALKVMNQRASPAALKRFQYEAEILGRLRHPHIAQVYDAGVHVDGAWATPYFALELVPGAAPLNEHVVRARLSTRQRLELFSRVCEAVHYGHQQGIIHRDLKPANILVDPHGEPKVIDFGVARATDADLTLTTQHTAVGALVGTIQYMSPEQCEGDAAGVDTRSDVYSLGVVLYELLTGALPYDAASGTIYAAMWIIREQVPRAPSTVDRRLRGDLDAILLKALEKDPARRYVSVAELAQDIRRHLAGEPIEARAAGRWQRLLRWVGRRPRTGAVLSTVLVCALVASGAMLGIKAYVWYELQEPVGIEPAGTWVPELSLLSRRSTRIHTWRAGGTVGKVFGAFAHLYPEDEDRKFGVLGFNTASLPDRACQLHLYDLRDPEHPLWRRQLGPDDLPEQVGDADNTADQFCPCNVWTFNVFPDTQGAPLNEIVCEFTHNKNSLRALCIYDRTGKLLYRIWHDGGILDCYWMSGPRLLILAGENQEHFANNPCGIPPTPESYLLVIFALQPSRGYITAELLNTVQPGTPVACKWYKWLSVCPIRGISWRWTLQPPSDGDASSSAELCLSIDTDPPCGMTWRIDAKGNQIPGTLVCPDYKIMRDLHPELDLPPVEAFTLQDTPPGR